MELKPPTTKHEKMKTTVSVFKLNEKRHFRLCDIVDLMH